jgi:hypothetical protein
MSSSTSELPMPGPPTRRERDGSTRVFRRCGGGGGGMEAGGSMADALRLPSAFWLGSELAALEGMMSRCRLWGPGVALLRRAVLE